MGLAFWRKKEEPKQHRWCAKCGVAVKVDFAQEIKDATWGKRHYCDAHRVPYDEVQTSWSPDGKSIGTKCSYFKRFEVDEQGVPLGYRAKKNG